MSESNSFEALKVQKRLMTISAAWPIENSTLFYKIREVFFYLTCVVLCVTFLIEAYHSLTNFARLSQILYMLLKMLSYILKHPNFYFKRKTFLRMIKMLENSGTLSRYSENFNEFIIAKVKVCKILATVFMILVYCCVFAISTSPIFGSSHLPFPFPYEVRGIFYYVLYFFQVLGLSICACNNPCIDLITAALMCIAATHLGVLFKKLEQIKNDLNDTTMMDANDKLLLQRMKDCIKYHLAIITFVKYIEEVFSFSILLQFIGSMFVICITLVDFVLVPIQSWQSLMMANFLINLSIELFIYCWFGNEVFLKSTGIIEACYSFKWYDCDVKVQKFLFLIMERSKRPLKITAYGFSTVSLAAFASIIQWSYSYYAILMKLYKKSNLNNN